LNKVREILNFLSGSDDELLMDYIKKDLGILGLDSELATIYDNVESKHYTISLEDIVNTTKRRIFDAVSTFDDEKLTASNTESTKCLCVFDALTGLGRTVLEINADCPQHGYMAE